MATKMATRSHNDEHLENHILGTLYGHCIGDAVGLLTEFMTKREAAKLFPRNDKGEIDLQFDQKRNDRHRNMWKTGDWTDDTDQMILIMDSLLAKNGEVDPKDYGAKIKSWWNKGFPELGDTGGCGLGQTTYAVIEHKRFKSNPHEAARDIWQRSGCQVAPNGAVMRTSLLGIYRFTDVQQVKQNTLEICYVTHADPRCAASCLAVTCAIAFMLLRKPLHFKDGRYNVDAIIDDAFNEACSVFEHNELEERYKADLKWYMNVEKLSDLKLDEAGKIGYTYKTLGAGFWALRQNDFKQALTAIVMEAGDADTNGAVAGALLGCKLGYMHLAQNVPHWLFKMCHKDWFDKKIKSFLQFALPEMNLMLLGEGKKQLQFEESGIRKSKPTPVQRQQSKAKAEDDSVANCLKWGV